MDEREDPGARLRAFRAEGRCGAPDGEHALLDRVLGEPLVANDAKREPVCDAADPVVQLSERGLVPPGDERDQGLVGQMGVLAAHRPGGLGPDERYQRCGTRTSIARCSHGERLRFSPVAALFGPAEPASWFTRTTAVPTHWKKE